MEKKEFNFYMVRVTDTPDSGRITVGTFLQSDKPEHDRETENVAKAITRVVSQHFEEKQLDYLKDESDTLHISIEVHGYAHDIPYPEQAKEVNMEQQPIDIRDTVEAVRNSIERDIRQNIPCYDECFVKAAIQKEWGNEINSILSYKEYISIIAHKGILFAVTPTLNVFKREIGGKYVVEDSSATIRLRQMAKIAEWPVGQLFPFQGEPKDIKATIALLCWDINGNLNGLCSGQKCKQDDQYNRELIATFLTQVLEYPVPTVAKAMRLANSTIYRYIKTILNNLYLTADYNIKSFSKKDPVESLRVHRWTALMECKERYKFS